MYENMTFKDYCKMTAVVMLLSLCQAAFTEAPLSANTDNWVRGCKGSALYSKFHMG